MASTVLSGAKSGTSRVTFGGELNVSPATLYTNNTTQNVRIVINYMGAIQLNSNERVLLVGDQEFTGTPQPGFDFMGPPLLTHYPMILTLAGASVSANLHSIGRNIAFFERTLSYSAASSASGNVISGFIPASGGIRTLSSTDPTYLPTDPYYNYFSINNIPIGGSTVAEGVSLAVAGNNAGGGSGSLPTEIMLAPNQSFGAACGVYNIIVIPENG